MSSAAASTRRDARTATSRRMRVRAASPSLSSIFPRGGQRGTEVVLDLNGDRLEDAQEILYYSSGIETVKLEDVKKHYHQVMFTVGAQIDRRMGNPGEDLGGSHTATEFVAWYNGHPDYRDREFDLSHEAVAVVGPGPVDGTDWEGMLAELDVSSMTRVMASHCQLVASDGDELILALDPAQAGLYSEDRVAKLRSAELVAFDRYGRRIDEVRHHPAYHELMRLAIEHEAHSVAWSREGDGGAVAHAAAMYLLTQPEQGYCCPITMTHAAVPALRRQPDVAAEWARCRWLAAPR